MKLNAYESIWWQIWSSFSNYKVVRSSCGSKYFPGSIISKFDAHLDRIPVDIYMIANTNVTDHVFRNVSYGNGHISEDLQRILASTGIQSSIGSSFLEKS